MKITVNGKVTEVPAGTSLSLFVEERGLRRDGIIAELNERVIAGVSWESTVLLDGDCLELVSLVGGG